VLGVRRTCGLHVRLLPALHDLLLVAGRGRGCAVNTVTRRLDRCARCGEPREIAARGLCFRCYRRESRATERALTIDRHTPGIRREQKRIIRAYAQVMSGLADLGVSQEAVREVLTTLSPYLRLAADLIPGWCSMNSEQARIEFTVHADADSEEREGG
jgi:hypothetical protein